MGASGYGVFLGCLGAGAVAAASVLERIRQAIPTDRLLAAGTLVFAASLLAIAITPYFALACLAMASAGAAWTTTLSTLNAITQLSVSSWVRGRALAVYQIVFFGVVVGNEAGGNEKQEPPWPGVKLRVGGEVQETIWPKITECPNGLLPKASPYRRR